MTDTIPFPAEESGTAKLLRAAIAHEAEKQSHFKEENPMHTAVRKTTCPKCGRTVETKNLEHHLRAKHGGNLPGGLVVSRRIDEKIIIGGNIVVTIVDIRGDKCRVHISAPPEVEVHREEVYQAIHAPEHINIVREELTLETEETK